MLSRSLQFIATLVLTSSLVACGGGGGGDNSRAASNNVTDPIAATPVVVTPAAVTIMPASTPQTTGLFQEAGAPQPSGNTATDGLNWFNFRRSQLGQGQLARIATLDTAAQGHSGYQQLNDTITHEQIVGKLGFTGVKLNNRLSSAGYTFMRPDYAYGEVLSTSVDQSGFKAAEELITAIYLRFAVFEPIFRQAGVGSAVSSSGRTYFTTDFAADGLTPVLGKGNFVVYPIANQQGLQPNFYSDFETPDPVPNRNQVGYPISVHADLTSTVVVQRFVVRPRGGANLQTILLDQAGDAQHTPASAAAIVPLDVLNAATTYDVEFAGTVDGITVTRNWSFTTR